MGRPTFEFTISLDDTPADQMEDVMAEAVEQALEAVAAGVDRKAIGDKLTALIEDYGKRVLDGA